MSNPKGLSYKGYKVWGNCNIEQEFVNKIKRRGKMAQSEGMEEKIIRTEIRVKEHGHFQRKCVIDSLKNGLGCLLHSRKR